jgi:hypothetical protein
MQDLNKFCNFQKIENIGKAIYTEEVLATGTDLRARIADCDGDEAGS